MKQKTARLVKGKALISGICVMAVLIALAVILPLTTRTALADTFGDYEYAVNEDGITATITGYTGSGVDITIPDTVTDGTNTYTVTAIGNGAFFSKDKLINVYITNGIIAIGDQAFFQCDNMISISIPATVTVIGDNVFGNCYNLENISVDTLNIAYSSQDGVLYDYDKTTLIAYPQSKDSVSYLVPSTVQIIDENTMVRCDNLAEILVENGNSYFISHDGVLYSYDMARLIRYPIAKADISYSIPSGVTQIENHAFYWVSGIKNITIPSGVTSIGEDTFSYCTSLSKLTLPESITSIGKGAFAGCHALGGINIPEGVTIIEDSTFAACYGLASVEIPDSVTMLGRYAFAHCYDLTNVLISSSIISINDSAFDYCTDLITAYFYGDAPVMGDYVFDHCNSNFTIYYSSDKIGYSNPWEGYQTVTCNPVNMPSFIEPGFAGSSGDYEYWVTNGQAIITGYTGNGGNITIPSALEGYPVVRISSCVFQNNDSITVVTIPDGVTSIGWWAFQDCTNIASVSIADSVSRIGFAAFEACWSLTSIELPSALTSIEDALFHDCERLKYVTIPDGVTRIGGSAFSYTAIENITIPNSVISIGQSVFAKCSSLSDAYFLCNAPSIDTMTTGEGGGEGIFDGCAEGFTIYYSIGTTGYTNPWYGYTTEEYDPTSPVIYTINVAVNPSGWGTATGDGIYNAGSTVTLTAVPKEGYRFTHWTDEQVEVSRDAVYTFAVLDGSTITANFLPIVSPNPISAVAAGYNSIQLTWNAVEGAAGYEVWRSTSSGGTYTKVGTSSGTAYTDAGLAIGTAYYYKVKAYCTCSTATTYGSLSEYASATPAPVALNVYAAATSYNSVKVSWDAVPGATGYYIYRATSASGTYSYLKSTTALSYSNTRLNTGTTYYYQIRPYRTVGRTKVFGDYSAVTSATPGLSPVSTATATSTYPTKIKLTWSAVPGRTRYEVWWSTSQNGTYTLLGTTTRTYYNVSNLRPFQTYYYYVKVYRTVSRQKVYAASNSPVATATPVLANVTNVKAAKYSVTGNKLTWSSVSGANGYEVLRWDEAQGKYVSLGTTTRKYYYDKNLIPNRTYSYQVRAYRKVGTEKVCSTVCDPVSATPTFGSVTNPKAARSNATKIKLTWSAVSGRSGYEIYRATSVDGNYELIGSTTRTSYYSRGLTTGTPYYYKIRAYVVVNGVRQYSDYSAVVSATP